MTLHQSIPALPIGKLLDPSQTLDFAHTVSGTKTQVLTSIYISI